MALSHEDRTDKLLLGRRSKGWALFICLFLFTTVLAQEPGEITTEIRDSHIKANVPPEARFFPILERDVKAYLECEYVTIELLRRAPTQVGVAHPKYYLWVLGNRDGQVVTQGAMRVAAVNQERFDVLHYLTAPAILEKPDTVKGIFPPALNDKILQRASESVKPGANPPSPNEIQRRQKDGI